MRTIRNLSVLVVFAALSVWPALALARIGGGQHYSSPSRSSSSSSSSHSYSSSSSGSHSYSGPSSTSYSSGSSTGSGAGGGFLTVIFILIVVGVVLYRLNQQNQRGGDDEAPQNFPDETPTSSSGDRRAWVAALKERDPAFELDALYEKATQIFLCCQEAWSSRQLEPVRPFMSDASYQRFLTQLELMRAQNIRNVTADCDVLGIQLVGLEQNPYFDTVHLAIRARMRDTEVPWDESDEAAQEAARGASQESFSEVWSFVRKPGTASQPGKELLQGKCPNCGAPFSGGAANSCEYCGAIVNSGHYDWTLAEITQAQEAQEPAPPPGVDELRARDPAFSLEVLEDRTSFVFWRWLQARTTGTAALLAKVAPSDFTGRLAHSPRFGSIVFRDCAVGAVITRELRGGNGVTEADVEIRWSANTDGEIRSRTTIFLLTRGADAKTNASNGMSTARCPKCNAPLTNSASTHCDFCAAPLGSNPGDWLLRSEQTEET